MKLFLLCLTSTLAFAADWDSVQRIQPSKAIEVTTTGGTRTRATFVSASAQSIVLREASGERSIPQAEVRKVRVQSPGRRVRKGVIWTLVGLGAGVGLGFAVCPGCANEGHGSKYVAPGAAIGAGLGALGFLSSPYRTVYEK